MSRIADPHTPLGRTDNVSYSLSRYAANEAGSEVSLGKVPVVDAGPIVGSPATMKEAKDASHNQQTSPESPRNARSGLHESGWSGNMMADRHMSGSDPKMFPGVLTRGHRTNSLRSLTQADDGASAARDGPGDKSS